MAYLPFVGLLQLVSVLVLRVLALLRFDGGVHALLLHLGPREVQVFVGLLVRVQGALRRAERLLVLLLRLAEQDQRRLKLRVDPRSLGQVLKGRRIFPLLFFEENLRILWNSVELESRRCGTQ